VERAEVLRCELLTFWDALSCVGRQAGSWAEVQQLRQAQMKPTASPASTSVSWPRWRRWRSRCCTKRLRGSC